MHVPDPLHSMQRMSNVPWITIRPKHRQEMVDTKVSTSFFLWLDQMASLARAQALTALDSVRD